MNLEDCIEAKPFRVVYPAHENKYKRYKATHDWKFYYYFLHNAPPILKWTP